MVRMPHMSSSTRNTLRKLATNMRPAYRFAHQLKPSRGSSGSETIRCDMAAPRYVDAIVDHHGRVRKVRIIVN